MGIKQITICLKIFLALFIIVLFVCCRDGGGGGNNTTPTSVDLPKTGQTTSYAMGDDGDLEIGVAWPSQRFADNANGTVTDNLSGLMWAKDGGSPSYSLCTGGTMDWQSALNYVACLNSNAYLGYTDWRLPNRKELRSLIDYANYNLALPTGHPFTNVQGVYYWSSTTYAYFPAFAWYVDMNGGGVYAVSKDEASNGYVWPVRSEGGGTVELPETGQTICYDASGNAIDCANTGQDGEKRAGVPWPSTRFTVSGDCVTDNLTGLMWVKEPDSTRMTWDNALTYANGLTLGGYDDWRLPNVNELESLVNAGEPNTATWLDTQGFINVQPHYYWSSTTYANDTDHAWGVVDMDTGGVGNDSKAGTYFAWPVRAGH